MRSRILVFIFFITISSPVFAQKEIYFPAMACKKMNDKSFAIPDSTKGKYTIIGIAYSKKAEKSLTTWYEPAYQTFIQKKKTVFADEVYNVNTYFVAVFTGMNKAVSDDAIKSMKTQIQKELLPHVLTYTGEFTSYKKTLSITQNDEPYIFVLDDEGVIVLTISGPYTAEKMKQIEEEVSEAE